MTITSSFFGSVNGDRRYKADDFANYFADFIGNGVYMKESNALQVFAGDGMQVVVKAGNGFINGYRVSNDSDYVLSLDNADGVLKRIDRIVLRWSLIERAIEVKVKKGTFASTPVAPALQRDEDRYELALADVHIGNGAVSINQGVITDQRLNDDLCGVVHGVVDQVSTETIFNQFQGWLDEYKDAHEGDFDDWRIGFITDANDWMQDEKQAFQVWFEGVESILDENVAGNLLNLINKNANDILKAEYDLTNLNFDYSKTRINFIDLAIETEMLKQAQLTGVNANIIIETFQTIDDIDLSRGGYDSENKRLEV